MEAVISTSSLVKNALDTKNATAIQILQSVPQVMSEAGQVSKLPADVRADEGVGKIIDSVA